MQLVPVYILGLIVLLTYLLHVAFKADGRVVGGVAEAVSLVVGKTVYVKVVRVVHSLVLLAVEVGLHVVEDSHHDLQRHAAVRAGLMLRPFPDDLEKAC